MRTWVANDEAVTSILVYGEAIEYFRVLADYPRHRARLRDLLQGVTPYRLTYPILERYAELRLAMRPTGSLIGDVDTLIAATALHYSLTVVTLDGDYARVPGLSMLRLDRSALL
jgi:predicted nucleic acid-binding protein